MTVWKAFGSIAVLLALSIAPRAVSASTRMHVPLNTCTSTEYWETVQRGVANGGIVNSQLHYRINSDCSSKTYNDGVWQAQAPSINYIEGVMAYSGWQGNQYDNTSIYCWNVGSGGYDHREP